MSDTLLFDQWLERVTSDIDSSGALNSASSYWKRYFHFDTRLTLAKIEPWQKRLLDPTYVRSHSFYPFIKHEIIKKHFGKISIQNAKGEIRALRTKLQVKPTRPICYAAHQDALIYAWYAFKLHLLLEQQIQTAGLDDCIIAYRSVGQKCNIHFAKEAFDFVREQKKCVALAFDVKSFFDTLDHEIVRRSWCRLLGEARLPADHFTIYKSMTKFRFIKLDALKRTLGEEEFEERRRAGRLSHPADFRKRIVPLIETNKEKGIPQGAPLSAVLSNLYMFEADKILAEFAKMYGGYYRRYCDDLLLIVPTADEPEAFLAMREAMVALGLCLNDDKTEIRYFDVKTNANSLGELDCLDEHGKADSLQYLGLEFDGREIRLRSASLARYHHRLRRNVRQAGGMAFGRRAYSDGRIAPGNGKILKRALYEKYSSIGGRNFITYAGRAYSITGSAAIKKQYNKSVALISQCVATETARRQAKRNIKKV